MNTTTIKTLTIFGTHTDEKSKLRLRDRYSDTKEEAEKLANEFIINIKNKLANMAGVIDFKFYIDEIDWSAEGYEGSLPNTQYRINGYVYKQGRKTTKNMIYKAFNELKVSYF